MLFFFIDKQVFQSFPHILPQPHTSRQWHTPTDLFTSYRISRTHTSLPRRHSPVPTVIRSLPQSRTSSDTTAIHFPKPTYSLTLLYTLISPHPPSLYTHTLAHTLSLPTQTPFHTSCILTAKHSIHSPTHSSTHFISPLTRPHTNPPAPTLTHSPTPLQPTPTHNVTWPQQAWVPLNSLMKIERLLPAPRPETPLAIPTL